MNFAKRVFQIAGIYGILALLPQYFMERKIGIDAPPAITHPEYFYGFVGVGLAWQILFLIVAKNPVRFRPMMLPGVIEKVTFGGAAVILFFQRRLTGQVLVFAFIDLLLATLFLISYAKTPSEKNLL